jgi:pyruvate/2-oxoglutarate dehydrogenase complex dihydrolipoamide acyltransferase (E2) component
MAFFKFMDRHPMQMKKTGGTVMVSCLNMFGSGTGWGVPVASHTLNLTLGGIVLRPVLVSGNLENHEFLCVTVSVDHDLVDGAPMARFINQFKKLVEHCDGLKEL